MMSDNQQTNHKTLPKWPIYLTVTLYLLACIFSTGFYHWDEHFQILEFLSYINGHTTKELLPWEFTHQMRSWVQPFFYSLIQKPLLLLGLQDPFIQVFHFRLVTALMSLMAFKLSYPWLTERYSFREKKVYLFLVCFLWFLPMLNTRHSSEAFAGSLFMMALALFFQNRKPLWIIACGFIFTISIYARFQMGIAVLFFITWIALYGQHKIRNLLSLFVGFLLAFALCTFIDSHFYGELVLTPWNYFNENILLDKASRFGKSPWFDYLKHVATRSFLPFGLAIIFATVLFWRRNLKHPITWATLSFILVHQLVSHKELRFLFPLIFFLPFFLTEAYRVNQDKVEKYFRYIKPLLYINAVLMVFYTLKPMHPSYDLFKHIYRHFPQATELYYYGGLNPYRLAELPTHFFKRDNLQVSEFSNANQKSSKNYLAFGSHGRDYEVISNTSGCKLKHSNYPLFLFNIDKARAYIIKHKAWTLFQCNSL